MFLHMFADSTVEMGEMVDKRAGEDVKGNQGDPLGVGEAAEQPETDVLDIGEGLRLLHHRAWSLRRLRI